MPARIIRLFECSTSHSTIVHLGVDLSESPVESGRKTGWICGMAHAIYKVSPALSDNRISEPEPRGAISRPGAGMECDYIMEKKVGKFTFAIPEGHPEAGNKVEKAFEYDFCNSEDEARSVLEKKKLKLTDLVNDKLKSNARSNAYQTALLPYKPSEVSQDDIRERMIRDMIRLGISEEQARATVDSMLSGKDSDESDNAQDSE